MSSPEQLAEFSKKAILSPNIGKHGKHKTTIEKEKRRELFDELVSQEFPKLVKNAKPEYKIDQFMGKTPEVIQQTSKIEIDTETKEKIKKLLNNG